MTRQPKRPWQCRVCPWQACGHAVVQVVHPRCPRHRTGSLAWQVRLWKAAA